MAKSIKGIYQKEMKRREELAMRRSADFFSRIIPELMRAAENGKSEYIVTEERITIRKDSIHSPETLETINVCYILLDSLGAFNYEDIDTITKVFKEKYEVDFEYQPESNCCVEHLCKKNKLIFKWG